MCLLSLWDIDCILSPPGPSIAQTTMRPISLLLSPVKSSPQKIQLKSSLSVLVISDVISSMPYSDLALAWILPGKFFAIGITDCLIRSQANIILTIFISV